MWPFTCRTTPSRPGVAVAVGVGDGEGNGEGAAVGLGLGVASAMTCAVGRGVAPEKLADDATTATATTTPRIAAIPAMSAGTRRDARSGVAPGGGVGVGGICAGGLHACCGGHAAGCHGGGGG